jgi:hypothetical protein
MGADLLDGDVDLTEFELLDVQRVQGVGKGANGFPHLLMKGLAAPDAGSEAPPERTAAGLIAAAVAKAVTDGKVDEAPDISLGQQVMSLLGQAIASEAAEISAGSYGETRDVAMLGRAADIVSCWIAREQAVAAGQDPDAPCGCCEWCSGIGCGCCDGCGTGALMCAAAEKSALSGKEKDDLPDSAFAYIEPGGEKDADGKTTPRSLRHFPVHDKMHADNAMARIEQGAKFGDEARPKVEAAQRKFGESDGAGKAAVADGETEVDTGTGTGQLAELVAAEVAKALRPHEERETALAAELAKAQADIARFAALPQPGGPVIAITRAPSAGAGTEDHAAKAAYYRQQADKVADPQLADGYRQLARQADEKAEAQPAIS